MIRLMQFFNTYVSSGGGHGEDESMYDVVMHHLTDHVLTGGIFGKLNSQIFEKLSFDLGPLHFDMRITKWVLMLWVSVLLMALVFIPLGRKMKKAKFGSKSRWVNFWESFIGFVHDEVVEPNFDHKYIKTAMPYFSTVFFFILFCNLAGLVPGSATATGNLAVTLGLAFFTLFLMFAVGMVRQGPQWIFTGIVPHGIPIPIFPLLWAIEVLGLAIKPFALTVRLFANMTAGHVVIIIFLYLIMMFESYGVGVASVTLSLMIYLLELLVAGIQAYIFAALSAMFIGQSMHAH